MHTKLVVADLHYWLSYNSLKGHILVVVKDFKMSFNSDGEEVVSFLEAGNGEIVTTIHIRPTNKFGELAEVISDTLFKIMCEDYFDDQDCSDDYDGYPDDQDYSADYVGYPDDQDYPNNDKGDSDDKKGSG